MITVTLSEDKKSCVIKGSHFTMQVHSCQAAADWLALNISGLPVHWDIQPNKLNSLGQGYATKIVQEFEEKQLPADPS